MKAYRDVDAYLAEADLWPDEITALRPILVGCGLTEEIKWGKPCYTHDGRNIVIVQEMKAFLSLMFFKGTLLDDPAGVLEPQGEHTRSALRMTFRSVADVTSRAGTIEDLVAAAIDVEDAGIVVAPAPEPDLAAELRERIATDPAFRTGFASLTPGRRRDYHLYVAAAKQEATRRRRVDTIAPRVIAGKGLRDR